MKWQESLRRPDWLKELQAVLAVGVLLVGGLGLFRAGATAALGGSLPLRLPASGVFGMIDHGLRDGAAIAARQDVTVTMADPSAHQRLLWALTSMPAPAVVTALLVLLLRIVWQARRGDPFTMATVRRLRVLAVVALAGGYLAFLIELLAAIQLSSTVLTDGVIGFSQLPAHWFLIGFGLLAVAEVVKRGYAMRTELDTVV